MRPADRDSASIVLPPSRRSVVVGVAALTAAPLSAAAGPGRPVAAPPLRVGLIGCGSRGRGAAKNALMAAEGVNLVAVADVFPEPVRAALDGFAADAEI